MKFEWNELKNYNTKEYLRLFNGSLYIWIEKIPKYRDSSRVWCAYIPGLCDREGFGSLLIANEKTKEEAKSKAEMWLKQKCKEIIESCES